MRLFSRVANEAEIIARCEAEHLNKEALDDAITALNANDQILVRYCDAQGQTTDTANPNGSRENIAGICNETRNVFGLMPHPERACDPALGSTDGLVIFDSLLKC